MTDSLKKVMSAEEEKKLKEHGIDILSEDEQELVSSGVGGGSVICESKWDPYMKHSVHSPTPER